VLRPFSTPRGRSTLKFSGWSNRACGVLLSRSSSGDGKYRESNRRVDRSWETRMSSGGFSIHRRYTRRHPEDSVLPARKLEIALRFPSKRCSFSVSESPLFCANPPDTCAKRHNCSTWNNCEAWNSRVPPRAIPTRRSIGRSGTTRTTITRERSLDFRNRRALLKRQGSLFARRLL